MASASAAASASASGDAWVYDPSHQVYYHASSQTYAIPDAVTGKWSYLAARDFRPGESSSSAQRVPAQNGGREMEEGEVEEDVGWGGLMEPEELERALKAKSKGNGTDNGNDTNSRKPYSSSNGIGTDKHPAYGTSTSAHTQPYDDPAKYAWPPREPTPPQKEMPNHILRLVVKRSDVLQPGQVAVIDAREGGVQLGRDRVEKGGQVRLRLKEMEVSKTHAVIYWGKGGEEDGESRDGDGDGDDGWWLVDLGSTHGTFLRYQGDDSGQAANAERVRLSEPKHSSIPHRLTHLCGITIGSTSLIAHIHPSWPCGDCQITGDNEIRLDDGTSLDKVKESDEAALALAQLTAEPAKYAMDSNERRHNRELKRKREMAALRETLLNPGGSTPSPAPTDADGERERERSYLDRSAMRRKLHPQSPPPPSSSYRQDRNRATETAPSSNPTPGPLNPSRPAEPAGQSQSKFGLAMLANQGWTPGMGLGKTSEGRAEPVQVELRTEKRGLGATGSKAVADVGEGDWRQRGKQRRYDELRSAQ